MTIVLHNSSVHLLERAGDWLRQSEAENNLILGLCSQLAESPVPESDAPWWLSVEHAGAILGVAIMTPPRNLLITRLAASEIDNLIDFLLSHAAPVPGVAGPSEDAAALARRWSHKTGQRCSLHSSQRIYACHQVQIRPASDGRMRVAEPEDRSYLIDWVREFLIDVRMATPADRYDEMVDRMIARRSLFVWEDAKPVSSAAFSRETENGVAINYVYTPPDSRGRGYATSCVAELTQRRLDAGKRFCCLYTDLSNPTSNKIYQRIGYLPVCFAAMWEFR
jgi:predicted GNAT family acetyltransferase